MDFDQNLAEIELLRKIKMEEALVKIAGTE